MQRPEFSVSAIGSIAEYQPYGAKAYEFNHSVKLHVDGIS